MKAEYEAQLQELKSHMNQNWEDKSSKSKKYEKERQLLLAKNREEQKQLQRQFELEKQKRWALMEEKGDIEGMLRELKRIIMRSGGISAPGNDGNNNTNKINTTKRKYLFGKQSVVDAITAVKNGEIVCVVDDEDRENEGDLIMAAEKATPETIGFIVRYTSGVLCISLEDNRLVNLNLPPMYENNEDPKETAYAISCDAKEGTTTGISAADRATTFRKLVDTAYGPDAFTRPGHVFPLRYKEGGVLSRWGHTEAALDLSRLAGLRPGGVLAEVVNNDGSCMRLESPNGGLKAFSKQHKLVLTSVHDIIAYREELEDKFQFKC